MSATATKRKKDPALEQESFKRKLYCWIRQRRSLIAVHKVLYYDMSEPILDDAQFDYVETELLTVERRHPDIAEEVRKQGYLSPSAYVGAYRLPPIEEKAERLLEDWKRRGRPYLSEVPKISPDMDEKTFYNNALQSIIKYPI